MPDRLVSLLIQFCVQNGGHLSASKRADYFPTLADTLIEELEATTRATGITTPPRHRPP